MFTRNNTSPPSDVDWHAVLLSESFIGMLDSMARKRFPQESIAEEASTYLLEKLSENNFERLTGFKGNSKATTYAYSIASRLLEDFSRSKFGRPRPPAPIKAKGQFWVDLWKMLCIERQWPEVIKTKMVTLYESETLEKGMKWIKQEVPSCGKPGYSECCQTDLGESASIDPASGYLETDLEGEELELLLAAISALIGKNMTQPSFGPSHSVMNEMAAVLKNKIKLTEREQLLLVLTYEDGLSSRATATLLDLSPSKVQRLLRDVLSRLRVFLEASGMDLVGLLSEAS